MPIYSAGRHKPAPLPSTVLTRRPALSSFITPDGACASTRGPVPSS
ncbi:hypothetical protein [Motilibacter deserti]|uniref:Uncharacterized protein n=1 Tax=Motilibacter deserti TaxID=2714956 RepID=A0ABX0GY26_9ACTN|nr:hypothetical protein [Motilibacter deserti]NHC14679.1 hypothetical protein [Motilibacter deserti]